MRSYETIKRWSLVAGLAASVFACAKEQEQASTEEKPDAGAVDKTAQLDPSLAKAVEAAAAKPTPQAGAAGGPPPNGIFGPGEADKEMLPGAPAKITLGGEGDQPRYTLSGSNFAPKTKLKGTIQVAVQSDPQQGALPVDFALSFEGKAPVPEPGATTTQLTHVVATVDSATVAAAGLPPQLTDELKKLKGSRVEYQLAANGAGSNFTAILTKQGETSQLRDTVNALGDALATMTLPFPDKPVGTGAFWMATTRERVMGLETVTYRLIRVERAEPTLVTLTLETKRYATSNDFTLDVPGKWNLAEFQSVADGKAMIAHGQPFPFEGLLKLNFMAGVSNKAKPDEAGRVAIQSQSRFTFDSLQDPAGKSVSGTPQAKALASPAPATPPAAPATPPAAPAAGAP